MSKPLSHRHRAVTEDDLVFIRRLIAEHPGSSRRRLSAKLCEAWNWVQPNGALRQAGAPLDNNVCERALKRAILHRKGSMFYKTPNGAEVVNTPWFKSNTAYHPTSVYPIFLSCPRGKCRKRRLGAGLARVLEDTKWVSRNLP